MHTCGPTRNITSEFLRIRADFQQKKHRFGTSLLTGLGHGEGLLQPDVAASAASNEVEMATRHSLPPLWVDVVEDVSDSLERIKDKMSMLQKLQQRRLLKIFADDSVLDSPDRQIEGLSVEISELFRSSETKIENLRPEGVHDLDSFRMAHGLSQAERALRRSAQNKAASQLQSLSQEFRKQQKVYIQELKKRRSGDAVDFFEEKPPASTTGFSQQQQQLFQEVEGMDVDADQRTEEISRIAHSMVELHQIFKDVSKLVIDQGTLLDRIDYSVEQVAAKTAQANVHIRSAERRQKSNIAMRVIIGLVVAILVTLAIFVIKHL